MNLPVPASKNRLAFTNSPYLLAHADNPVDWYPWGQEALARATNENKPILLSIGYATCHWCHVMEHESFRDSSIAATMNEHFVCIKVDREERPDIDAVYMTATVALTGHGGWPMTVFLTPAGEVFFAGTYFPPEDRLGHPGFMRVLESIADLWNRDPSRVMAEGANVTQQLRAMVAPSQPQAIPLTLTQTAVLQLRASFDTTWGGFDSAPKFPPHAALRLLFDCYWREGSPDCLHMALSTLDHIQQGGIHDHLGGGFARYSTDSRWLVPHFEKMLYDNAQLAKAFLYVYRTTGSPVARVTLERLLTWVEQELTDPAGGFYTGLDADSEGVEGRFYVFDWQQVVDLLPEHEAEALTHYYDVRPEGNWEGTNVLWTPRSLGEVAAKLGIDDKLLEQHVAAARNHLSVVRAKRQRPLTDDKVIAGHTGLMLSAFAEAGRALGQPKYLEIAEKAAAFVIREMTDGSGGLVRCFRKGTSGQPAMLDDYAYVAEGLLTLYETTGKSQYLRTVERFTARMLADFYDDATERAYNSPIANEGLLLRIAEAHDGPLPNATAVAAEVLGRLSYHCERSQWREQALMLVNAHGGAVERLPRAHADLLRVARELREPRVIIVMVPGTDEHENDSLRAACFDRTWPGHVLAVLPCNPSAGELELPLFQGRTATETSPRVFVCRDDYCETPARTVEELDRIVPLRPSQSSQRNPQ